MRLTQATIFPWLILSLASMSRYEQDKDKKSGVAVTLVAAALIALTIFAGVYFKSQQSDIVTGSETRTLTLPSGFTETEAIDPLSIKDPLIGESTPATTADNIQELQLESSFILPDLDHSDALFRKALTGISPSLAGWLKTEQLIRKYVVIANDFSQGLRLEKHLSFLELDQPFTADQDNGTLFIASKSYHRYDPLAAAINALDARATLIIYKNFRPLLLQVFKEFSYPEQYNLEDIFTKTAATILAAPVIDGPIAVARHAVNYKFSDQQLEASSPIHKQMLRMGPENTRLIQNKLRQMVEGLVNIKE